MYGWIIPPPKKPEKTKEDFRIEREKKIDSLIKSKFLKSSLIREAMLKVEREEFILESYRDYAYEEVPLPLPGEEATISCPHSYPLFYEPLGLTRGDKFLEIGAGSGYGAAIAREIVGEGGRVITVEIDKKTYEFAKGNLEKLGYKDILVVHGDGTLGYPPEQPYGKICITAACPEIPKPLIDQLRPKGRLIAPVGNPRTAQDLILFEKKTDGSLKSTFIEKVLYVPLRGKYGFSD